MTYSPREEEPSEEKVIIPFSHAQLTANTTQKVWKCPAGKTFVLDRVLYINVTGLAADNTNAFKLEVKNGATLMSELFNTDGDDVPAGAALTADTFIEKTTNAHIPSRSLASAETVSLVFTEDGTATLPAGNGFLEGRLL